MDKPSKKLFLLDAYALIYQAHFAFTKTPRINSKGLNTSVPFGFTNTLLEVIQKQKPTHIGVAFDTTAKTFRDDIYAEYRPGRNPQDIRYRAFRNVEKRSSAVLTSPYSSSMATRPTI